MFISCKEKKVSNCTPPLQVLEYINKRMPSMKIIKERELSKGWNTFLNHTVACPTMIDYDFTGDGTPDYICMVRDIDGFPYVVAFNNYSLESITFKKVAGLADYGEHGIGNVLYRDQQKNGFYLYKIESSNAFIHWVDGTYKIEYEVD